MSKLFFENIDYNKVLLETENFIVIPSLGSLVEGWLLIIPRKFYINLSELNDHEMVEMKQIINQLSSSILPNFGKDYVLFEHGPQNLKSKTGCGVDHAHLHFVPFSDNLLSGLEKFLGLKYEWNQLIDLSDLSNFKSSEKDYLLLQDQKGNIFVTFQNDILGQTFRRVIANYIGKPNDFDWKCNFNLENIYTTINKVSLIEEV